MERNPWGRNIVAQFLGLKKLASCFPFDGDMFSILENLLERGKGAKTKLWGRIIALGKYFKSAGRLRGSKCECGDPKDG